MNYKDVSLLIPVRIDTNQRMKNLEGVLEYYHEFGFKIILGEEALKPECDFYHYRFPHLEYYFFKSDRSYFHRTKLLNDLIDKSKTKYIANYDCDVFFPKSQIDETITMLNEGNDMVYPYDGRFYNVFTPDLKNVLKRKFDSCRGWIINPASKGGAIFFNRESYIKGGGENENFVAWGAEDSERFHRFNLLGFKVKRVAGMCYHINHPRGNNSMDANPYFKQCEEEYKKVLSMSKKQLEAYIVESNFIKNI
jgi:predicted glycosyltransferase involved in capsule biosynthesis